jgi:hypothetical protein
MFILSPLIPLSSTRERKVEVLNKAFPLDGLLRNLQMKLHEKIITAYKILINEGVNAFMETFKRYLNPRLDLLGTLFPHSRTMVGVYLHLNRIQRIARSSKILMRDLIM